MKKEKETEKRIAFLVANLSWLALLLGEARAPWLRLYVEPLVGKLMQNVSFVNHKSVNKLHTSVNVNPLFSALINGS